MTEDPDVQTARDVAPLLLRACREALDALMRYPHCLTSRELYEMGRVCNLLRNAIAQAEGRK